jgi:putative tryptophan/tyrosine transport system substrate-binding protein
MPMRADADARFWLHIPGYGDRLRPGLRVLFNVRTNEGTLEPDELHGTWLGLPSGPARERLGTSWPPAPAAQRGSFAALRRDGTLTPYKLWAPLRRAAMSKRFAVILGFTLLSAVSLSASLYAPSAAEAQRAGKVPHIIFFRSGPPPQAFVEAFQQGLREFGYVEGKTVIVEYRFSDGTTRLLPELAREIVGRKPDAILASAVPAALAAKNATTTIPIVFAGTVDPVEAGLAANLARPGANVTGMSILSVDLLGKRLELLREVVPNLSSVALLWNPTNPTHAARLKHAERLTQELGVRLQMLSISAPQDFDRALADARATQALLQFDDSFFTTHRDRLTRLAANSRLPAIYGYRESRCGWTHVVRRQPSGSVPAGGRLCRQGSERCQASGPADPATDEVRARHQYEGRQGVGLTIPPALLLRADDVIE